jgi:hypothetical protein
MSQWTHALCETCWNIANPERPYLIKSPLHALTEVCCRCGAETRDGIYVRGAPTDMPHCPGHQEGAR